MDVAVVAPWTPGCPHREAAWRLVRCRYEALGWDVIEGTPPPGPWSKGAAVHAAIERTAADVLVIADADCWSDGTTAAVDAVAYGKPWARPHDNVHRLTPDATLRYLDGEPSTDCEPHPYFGMDGGGVVAISRSLYEEIPIDPRFAGWGGEDSAWGKALICLVGPAYVANQPLWHLWHPPQADAPRRRGPGGGRFMNDTNRALLERYKHHRGDPDGMRALIDEAREALHGCASGHQATRDPGSPAVS